MSESLAEPDVLFKDYDLFGDYSADGEGGPDPITPQSIVQHSLIFRLLLLIPLRRE